MSKRKIEFKSLLPHIVALLTFVILSIFYFSPQLEGKTVAMGDLISNQGMGNEVRTYKKETGEHSYWTNAMFGGMPTYQIVNEQSSNIAQYVESVFMLGFSRPIGYFIYAMIAFYILLIALGVGPWLSILGAVAFAFSTNNLILFEAGHASKLRAIFAAPIVIAGVVKAYEKQLVSGLVLFVLGMSLSVYANHIQMTYYLGLSLMVFVLIQLYHHVRSQELARFFKTSGFLLIGLLIAIGTGASNLLTTYEYAKDTMRGEPILTESTAGLNSSSQVDGLDWDYAMSWSNGTIDIFSSFIPMAAGGGSGYMLSSSSNVAKDLRKKGVNTRKGIQGPMYFGALPFTSGPIYFGAVICFLVFFSFFVIPKSWRVWLGVSIVLYFLLSMGKNMEMVNKLFFDFAPYFNKFRTPNSVLSISTILFPLAAIYGLWHASKIENKASLLKPLYVSAGVLSVVAILFALVPTLFTDFINPSDSAYAQRGYNLEAILADRESLLKSSAFRSLILVVLSGGALFLWIKDKLSMNVVIPIIGLLILFDQFQVGMKYFSKSDFVSTREYSAYFKPRPVDDEIKRDKDIHYRVHDLTIDPFNSSNTSYHHKTIGGYHPAKLQRYQDVIDRHIGQGNQKVLDMLNMKYAIFPDQQSNTPRVQRNPSALGNAWFIKNIEFVNTPDAEINALSNFDPSITAIVNQEFQSTVKSSYDNAGSINLTDYAPDRLTYKSTNNQNAFAVFSEVWYGPNKGWKVTVDGQAANFVRANYVLRAMEVPAGNHEIVFSFDPASVRTGNLIGLICSVLLLFGLLFLGFNYWKSI